ncbi:MAG: UDP-glucose 6-dehydrogenase, partial [Bacteroidaceae bacterium]|nr:UDP-glucose 6-dehydrogenase [Bacteroidaceae bacterium]
LLEAGCTIRVFDPVAMDECRRRLGDKVIYAKDIYDAALGADALLLLTEWKQFRLPSWEVVRRAMTSPVLIDGRNLYNPAEMRDNGFEYFSIGRPGICEIPE